MMVCQQMKLPVTLSRIITEIITEETLEAKRSANAREFRSRCRPLGLQKLCYELVIPASASYQTSETSTAR